MRTVAAAMRAEFNLDRSLPVQYALWVATVATGMGYDVRAVVHSRDVEFQLSGWQPTVLFLDVFMPDRDGLEMLGLLQQHAPADRRRA